QTETARSSGRPLIRLILAEAIGRLDQLMEISGLGGRVAGIGHDPQVRFRKGTVERPGAGHRADDIVTPLDNHGRYVADTCDVRKELIVTLEESVVDKVVTLDPGECKRKLIP